MLGLVVTEWLVRERPDADEGELSSARASAVNQRALAERARALGLEALVRLGRGERRSGGGAKDSILANALEAVIGALYLDGGLEITRAFVLREMPPEALAAGARVRDAKTTLQERLQAEGRSAPRYETVATSGPPHAPEFEVEVRVDGALLGRGAGRSKREAEQAAAGFALAHLAGEAPVRAREKSP